MAILREILTRWTVPGDGGGTSVMYFATLAEYDAQRTALGDYWTAVNVLQGSGVSWMIEPQARLIESTTGALTGLANSAQVETGTNTIGADVVPNAAQALVRWRTGAVVGNRLLRGRTFIPGISETNTQGGHLIGSAVTALTNASTALVAANIGLGVWSRPSPGGSDGAFADATSADAWAEFATQRRRRV